MPAVPDNVARQVVLAVPNHGRPSVFRGAADDLIGDAFKPNITDSFDVGAGWSAAAMEVLRFNLRKEIEDGATANNFIFSQGYANIYPLRDTPTSPSEGKPPV